MPFGQVVIGPPGSGKTTYCNGMSQFMEAIKRPVAIVNLDPANEQVPYTAACDVSHLIRVQDVMSLHSLGPNGGLLFCMKYLLANFDWLKNKLEALRDKYILFDMPGQVELYTHQSAVRDILAKIQKMGFRITAVHLVDSYYCIEPTSFVSILLLSLSTMLQLELPHVNVLSKIDLLRSFGELQFNLEYYTEVQDLEYLLNHLDEGRWSQHFKSLNRVLCEVISSYSLVAFSTLNIQDKESVWNLLQLIDKSNGYLNLSVEENQYVALMTYGVSSDFDSVYLQDVQEKYIDSDLEEMGEEGEERGEREEDEKEGEGERMEVEKKSGGEEEKERENGGDEKMGEQGEKEIEDELKEWDLGP